MRTYTEAMPQTWHTDLLAGDTVSTALAQALTAGWSVQQLIDDALAAHRRGAGMGAVVTRLRTLARSKPPKSRPIRPVERFTYVPDPDDVPMPPQFRQMVAESQARARATSR